MANVRPINLPRTTTPSAEDILVIDLATTRGATARDVVNAARPFANQSEAEGGTRADVAMSPLTTKQAIEAQIGSSLVQTITNNYYDPADGPIDLGDTAVLPTQVEVYIDGLPQDPDTYTVAGGIITPIDGWVGDRIRVRVGIPFTSTTDDLMPTRPYGANGEGGAADYQAAVDMFTATNSDLPRLQRWVNGSIKFSQIRPNDTQDPWQYLQAFCSAFPTGIPGGAALVFDRHQAFNLAGAYSSYPTITVPKTMKFEWERAWDATGLPQTTFNPVLLRADAVMSLTIPINGEIFAGQSTISLDAATLIAANIAFLTAYPNDGALFKRGRRMKIVATAGLTDLKLGAWTLLESTSINFKSDSLIAHSLTGSTLRLLNAPELDYPTGSSPVLNVYLDMPYDMEFINPSYEASALTGVSRGYWVTGTTYAVDDVVSLASSNEGYRCATAHTAGVFATDLAAGKWLRIRTASLLRIEGADNVKITGGDCKNWNCTLIAALSTRDLLIDGLRMEQSDVKGSIAGGLYIGDDCIRPVIRNLDIIGGNQSVMFSSGSGAGGITRDALIEDCRSTDGTDPFSQHQLQTRTTYRRNTIIRASLGGIDIRSPYTTAERNFFYDCPTQCIIAGGNPKGLVVDRNYFERCGSPISISTSFVWDEPPHDITVTNNKAILTGGVGTQGGINLVYDQVGWDGLRPTLGKLTVSGNDMGMIDNGQPYSIGGMWKDPVIINNTARADGFKLSYNTKVADFVRGTITGGTSGAKATLLYAFNSTTTGDLFLDARDITGTFVNGETLTGSKGGSATSNIPSGLIAPAGNAAFIHDARTYVTQVNYDTGTGAFTPGQIVTDSVTGATGRIVAMTGTILYVYNPSAVASFADNDAITDPLGGAALVNGAPVASQLPFTGYGPINPTFLNHVYPTTFVGPSLVGATGTTTSRGHVELGKSASAQTVLATSTTLDNSQSGMDFNNTGATALVVVTMYTAALGTSQRFFVTDADGIRVTATGSATFRHGSGAAGSANGTLTSTTIGSWAEIVAVSTTSWVVICDNTANWTIV